MILRISDHKDLEAASAAWSLMAALVSEQRIWRQLTNFHFTEQQICSIIEKKKITETNKDKKWQKIYHELRK